MKKRASLGFTLIELLVATAVTVMIVGLMITMVSNLLTAYNRSSGALAAQSQAGLVLDSLATELESLVVRDSDEVMLAATIREDPSEMKWGESLKPEEINIESVEPGDRFDRLEPIEDQRFGKGGVWLRFISSAPSMARDPDAGVRAIGYNLALDGVTDGSDAPLQYMLYRVEVPAEDTFDNGYDLSDPSNPTVPILASPDESDIIAGNVVDFGIRFFEISRDPDDLGQRGLLFPMGPDDLEYLASGTGPEFYPDVIEVMVRILTPEGERLLEALRDDNITGDWWDIVIENSEVYSRVIKIPSKPL
ncbi:MAG: type II secretion system protein J [Puniceicoccaceae bacterium]